MRKTLTAVLALLLLASSATATEPTQPPEELEELSHRLAQLYISEASWAGLEDHPAIYWALRNRAETLDRSMLEQMRRYSRPLFRPTSARQAWIAALRTDGAQPDVWPENVSWDRYTDRWKLILSRARAHVREAPRNPCDGRVEHWGGMRIARDRVRADRALERGAWRRLDCGETRNTFFEVLRRRRSPRERVAIRD